MHTCCARRFGCWALQPWMHRPTRQHCISKGQCCCCFTSCSGAGKQGWPKGPSGHLAAWSKAMWICRQRLRLRSAAILCLAAIGDVNLPAICQAIESFLNQCTEKLAAPSAALAYLTSPSFQSCLHLSSSSCRSSAIPASSALPVWNYLRFPVVASAITLHF